MMASPAPLTTAVKQVPAAAQAAHGEAEPAGEASDASPVGDVDREFGALVSWSEEARPRRQAPGQNAPRQPLAGVRTAVQQSNTHAM